MPPRQIMNQFGVKFIAESYDRQFFTALCPFCDRKFRVSRGYFARVQSCSVCTEHVRNAKRVAELKSKLETLSPIQLRVYETIMTGRAETPVNIEEAIALAARCHTPAQAKEEIKWFSGVYGQSCNKSTLADLIKGTRKLLASEKIKTNAIAD